MEFEEKVIEIVRRIPSGYVTSYGAIAEATGLRSSARMVGWVLNRQVVYHSEVPCHRVVNRAGELTGKMHFGSPTMMREMLESEGVSFIEEHVDMKKHFWDPRS